MDWIIYFKIKIYNLTTFYQNNKYLPSGMSYYSGDWMIHFKIILYNLTKKIKTINTTMESFHYCGMEIIHFNITTCNLANHYKNNKYLHSEIITLYYSGINWIICFKIMLYNSTKHDTNNKYPTNRIISIFSTWIK